MTTFLTQCPWVSEFKYKWSIPVVMRSIMLADVARPDYSKKKKKEPKEDVVKEGNLADFLRGN